MEAGSMSEAVRILFDKYPMDYEFGLWNLKDDVLRLYPPSKNNHADTVSRRLREFRYGHGYEIKCINPNESRYKKLRRPKKNGKNWQGWTPESGMTKLEWFANEKVACKCTTPCEACGFNYLDIDGQELTNSGTPLCGVR